MVQLAALLAPRPFKKRILTKESLIENKIVVCENLCYLVKPQKKKGVNAKK